MTPRVAILISGGGSNMVTLVNAMRSDMIDATPVVVISNIPTADGLQKARDLQVHPHAIDHRDYNGDRVAFETDLHKVLIKFNVDIVCLAGFMRILTSDFTDKWGGRVLNIHPSLLPKYKGLHTHQRAIDAGDSHGGCSVHIVTGALDGGPVLGQTSVPIVPNDSADDLAARVLVEEHKLYPAVLADFVKRYEQ
tara:strand:+ start:831 stop:1412 length:582 start_codon:yes stop_codon:yes gene_type:complete